MDPPANLLDDLPADLSAEVFQTILRAPGVRVERIVSLGHASPEGFWYDQDWHEWVLLLKGAARLSVEGREPVELRPGDSLNLPAHARHRVDWTDPHTATVWLAIHYEAGASPDPMSPGP